MSRNRGQSLLVSVLVVTLLQLWLPGGQVGVAASSPQFYVVAPGDTLTGIADRFGISVMTLAQMNGLASPDYLQVGQKLALSVPAASSTATTAAPPPTSSGSQRTHVVSRGETLTDIAQTYGASVEDLAVVNGLRDQDFITAGQILTIPNSSSPLSPSSGADTGNQDQQTTWLKEPYRSQFDGTSYEEGNCGPATLGMLMAYYDQWWSTDELRRSVNKSMGYWGLDGGSDWESLVYAAETHGFRAKGLYDGPKRYRKWTVDELVQEVQQGRPVMLLVRYQTLPGHEGQSWWGDHYIAFLGLNANGDVVYHDSAFRGSSKGAYRTMTKDRLIRVWANTSVGIAYSAMSLEWLGQ